VLPTTMPGTDPPSALGSATACIESTPVSEATRSRSSGVSSAPGKSGLAMSCTVCAVDCPGVRRIAMLVPPGLDVERRIVLCASFCNESSSTWSASSVAVAESKIDCARIVARCDSDWTWSRRWS
jgi:hypothetical protein